MKVHMHKRDGSLLNTSGKPTESIDSLNQLVRLCRDPNPDAKMEKEALLDLLKNGGNVGVSGDASWVAVLVVDG